MSYVSDVAGCPRLYFGQPGHPTQNQRNGLDAVVSSYHVEVLFHSFTPHVEVAQRFLGESPLRVEASPIGSNNPLY